MPKIVRDKSGQTIVVSPDGSRRPASSADLQDMTITNPNIVNQEESGVEKFERFNLKNFAANPGAAKAYLRSLGYEVANFGSGFNFAVRNRGETQWKVVDPPVGHGGVGEFFKDMTDLTADVLGGFATGAATTAGAVGGLPGAVAAGAGAGAGVEAGRQGIGSALGIPDNTDLGQVATVGALSGALPVAGAGLRAVGRGAASLAGKAGVEVPQMLRTAGARIAGIKDQPGMDAGEILSRRAAIPAGEVIKSPSEFLDVVRAKFDHIANREFPEVIEARRILNQHPDANVNVTGMVRFLRNQRGSLRNIEDVDAAAKAGRALDQISELTGADLSDVGRQRPLFGPYDKTTPREIIVSARQADKIKSSLQDLVDSAKGYEGKPGDKTLTRNLRLVAHKLRLKMEDALGGRSGQYAKANASAHEKIEARDAMRDMFGGHVQNAESNVINLIGKGKKEARDTIENFDRIFNTHFKELADRANVGYRINPTEGPDFGKGELLGRMTATGNFVGTGLVGTGAITGGFAGGPLGALAGAGVGLGAAMGASPRAIIGLTRAAQRTAPITAGASAWVRDVGRPLLRSMTLGNLPPEARASALNAFQQGLARLIPQDKPVIRQDAKRRELEGR